MNTSVLPPAGTRPATKEEIEHAAMVLRSLGKNTLASYVAETDPGKLADSSAIVVAQDFSYIFILLAREAPRDLLSSVENIQKTVADYYKIKVSDMCGKKRPASIARPRQIAMYLVKELTEKSLPEIGELFGGRDHTTVLHAVTKIATERQQLTELNQQVDALEQALSG